MIDQRTHVGSGAPHYYTEDVSPRNLNGHNQRDHSKNFGVGRNANNVPRYTSNGGDHLGDEDMIETASSASFSSGYGRVRNGDNQNSPLRYVNSQSQPQRKVKNNGVRMQEIPEKFRDEKDGSEIYVMDSTYAKTPASIVYSQYSGKSRAPSEMSSVRTKTSRKGGVQIETMSAPNPFCPHTKGVCCLLVLVNLGLILVTLGFSVVLQLFDPPFVWYCGVAFLIVGFLALVVSLIFCVHLCREAEVRRQHPGLQPGELYWTHHWQKRISLPGFTRERSEKLDDVSTVYSARTDMDDKYYVRNEQKNMSPIHSYNHH